MDAIGEVPEAIRSIARPIYGEAELDVLVEIIGDARLVVLGAASQGSHELHDLRASITRRLIARHGFAAVAIEADWADALRVDRYIRQFGDDESSADALGGFERFPRWMWRNTDIVRFVDWLYSANATRRRDDRAGFYGLDLYSLHASIHALVAFLDHDDPIAARIARERYACFDHAGGDPEVFAMLAERTGRDCEDELVAQLVEMQLRRAARSGRTPSGPAWFHAMQDAHVIRDAESYYRGMFAPRELAWNLRDTHFANAIDLLAQQLGSPARIVVWAHDAHAGDARATELGRGGRLTLGQLLRQRHDGEVALVGFTTHEGTVACARTWGASLVRERVRPALPGSWEELFHAAEIPRFMVTAEALRRTIGDAVTRLHRAIGVVYRPATERASHYYASRIAEQYDVIVHVDRTRAVEPLDRVVAAPRLAMQP
jgi:erythromycin esterase-like protein